MAFSPTGTPKDIVNLYYWQSTAFMLYMFVERLTPTTNVTLGSLVGRMEGQVQPTPYITNAISDAQRPTYTSEGAENAYIIYDPTFKLSIQNSTNTFRFLYEEALRKWTIALKVRFHSSVGTTELILDSNHGTSSLIGFWLQRNTNGTLNFAVTSGPGTVLSMVTTDKIDDLFWHDIVITANGDGAGACAIKIDDLTPLTGTYTGFLADGTNMAENIATGGLSHVTSNGMDGDMADLIILDDLISTQDEIDWRAYSQIPTMDVIAPGGVAFSSLIRSEDASITPGIILAREIG